MRHPVLLIFVNAMILIAVFALLTQSLFITQRLAQARVVSGHVEVQRGAKGAFRALAQNEFVKSGDIVRTREDGQAEFTWAGGTRWKLMPSTVVKVRKATASSGHAEQSQLQMFAGRLFVRIARPLSSSSRFEIETPDATASVRGTIFSIEVRDRVTQVRVWKGEAVLAARDDGQKILVEPGEKGSAGEAGGTVGLREERDASIEREFEQQPSIARPELEAQVRDLGNGRAQVWGTTEAGDEVSVNGRPARVLSSGAFRLQLARPRDGRFTITSTDAHGGASMWRGALPAATEAAR